MISDKSSLARIDVPAVRAAYIDLRVAELRVLAAKTAVGQFLIEASGMSIQLVCTRTAGTIRLIASPLRG